MKNRPREKLERHGSGRLSNSELLAVVFNSGTRREDVFTLAKRSVSEYGVNFLAGFKRYEELKLALQLPRVKTLQLLAILELGRRIYTEEKLIRASLTSPRKVFTKFSFLQSRFQEELWGAFTDVKQTMLWSEHLALGAKNIVRVDIAHVLEVALAYQSRGIILVHNHPTGDVRPSHEDILLTNRVDAAARILGLQLLDHIIVGKEYFSFLEAGLLPERS